jgi:hypothetical protein
MTIVYANRTWLASLVAVVTAALTACAGSPWPSLERQAAAGATAGAGKVNPRADGWSPKRPGPTGDVTLAFAGDTHFQLHLAALLGPPQQTLGPIARTLADADLTMVNLESAITHRGTPDPKEREVPENRYYFRTGRVALDVLADAGVDVVTMANNHGADYGPVGLADTLRAIRRGPVHVVGIGRNRRAAFTPYRVTVRGTPLAFFGADASFREGSSPVWVAGPRTPGVAAAHASRPLVLLDAVRAASRQGDLVVVYMHWGKEERSCPTAQQQATAGALAEAGADIVVGSHAHVLLGSGWLGDTYVNYGLGNFLWYHNHQPESGVLHLRIHDGRVVSDSWVPARLETYGRQIPLAGKARVTAVADWRRLRACTCLAARPLP